MKKILITILLFTAINSYAHGQAYKFVKSTEFFKLAGADTIKFENYAKKENGVKQRIVSTSKTKYLFVLKKNKIGRVQEITDSNGKVIATVLITGKGKYDVVASSGERYIWKKIDGRNWAYEYNGDVVLKGAYQKEGSTKKLVNTGMSEQVPEFLLLSSFERGGDTIITKSNKGPVILVAVLAAVVAQAR